MGVLALLCVAAAARAQPTADQVLSEVGMSAGDRQRVMKGEFVTTKVAGVSERDLAFATAFLVKTSPDELGKQILAGTLVTTDPQVQSFGPLGSPPSLADFAGLKLTADEAKQIANAGSGDRMNLSASEQEAFKIEKGGTPEAIEDRLRRLLLSRYEAYRASGLAGIAPYDRGGGVTTAVASDLRKASEAATELNAHLPGFEAVLLGYPQATFPGMEQKFAWVKSNVRGKPTFVLAHIMISPGGEARAFVRREFYVSTGYDAEQSVAGFLPVDGGAVVLYMSHAFTDQVAGSGGSIKRSLGGRIMADQMKEIFENGRKRVEH
jgi:hypothetical protein